MKLATKYLVNIRRLSDEEGGGFLVEYPDLPGCMADGGTIEEALHEGEDAVKAWKDKYQARIDSEGNLD